MNLDTTSKSLQVLLGESTVTTPCDITASWAEMTIGTFLPQSGQTVSNGTTAVTVVSAPTSNQTTRQVKEVRVHNNDTVAHTVVLRLNNGGTFYIVMQSNPPVPAGGDFVYTPDAGAIPAGTGTVTDVVAGAGLNVGAGPGGSITNAGTLNVKPATTAAIGGVVIGTGITVNTGGTISAAGGGGGSYIEVESGASQKISTMTTLPNLPTAPVYDAVITNNGTTTTNYQRPQGHIVNPTVTGSGNGLGIRLVSGGLSGAAPGTPGHTAIYGGYHYFTGTTISVSGAGSAIHGGNASIPGTSTHSALGGEGFVYGGLAAFGSAQARGAELAASGGTINSTTAIGGTVYGYGGQSSVTNATGGAVRFVAGSATGTGGVGGPATIAGGNGVSAGGPVLLKPGTGSTNGVVIMSNTGTVNPHVLGAVFQAATANLLGYYSLYLSHG